MTNKKIYCFKQFVNFYERKGASLVSKGVRTRLGQYEEKVRLVK
jgi:hypothetical protein